jgi:hypothetical protein
LDARVDVLDKTLEQNIKLIKEQSAQLSKLTERYHSHKERFAKVYQDALADKRTRQVTKFDTFGHAIIEQTVRVLCFLYWAMYKLFVSYIS